MDIFCSQCGKIIPPEKLNIATDLAQCTSCNFIGKVSELLENKTDVNVSSVPPGGSRIIVQRGALGEQEFLLPASGFKFKHFPLIIFMIFWFGFLVFWSFMAAQASIAFSLFSIPFWAVGIYMIIRILNEAKQVQTISTSKTGIKITKKKIFGTSVSEFPFSDIHDIRFVHLSGRDSINSNFDSDSRYSLVSIPAIITGGKTNKFFESASEAEKDWVVKYLNNLRERN